MRLNKTVFASILVSTTLLFGCRAQLVDTEVQLSVFEPETVDMDFSRNLVDSRASAGEYRAATADGTTLARLSVEGQRAFEVWVRYRGAPLVLKAADGHDIGRLGVNDSSSWKWASFGVFDASDVGHTVDVFAPFADRKASDAPSGLDLVVLTQPKSELSVLDGFVTLAPEESLTVPDADVVLTSDPVVVEGHGPIEVNVVVNWEQPTGRDADRQYSLNIFNGYDPKIANNPKYVENVAYMASPILRYHNMSGMVADPAKNRFGWVDVSAKTWDAEIIASALDPLEGLSPERVITIGRWPGWMDVDKDGMLDKDQYDAFAQLCAELVQLLNVEQQRGIQYFEITNERDMLYWLRQMKKGQPLQIDELADIYNRCVTAMKAVDPSIKIGGPAACRGDLVQPLKQFAILTFENLDFLSYHAYASGDATELDINIYNRASSLGKHLASMRRMLDELSPRRHIELHLNEYNICYTHRVQDKRMANNKGGVFDALVFVQLVQNGIDVGNAWNECDGVYGKMDRSFSLRPGAHVFHYFNKLMTGSVVAVSSDHEEVVVPLAVEHGKDRNWVLINRSPFSNIAKVRFEKELSPEIEVAVYQLSESGLEQFTKKLSELEAGIELSPDSVVFFSLEN